jgi:4-diphosphocytidyl-2-C-methyl-D-erythritol kinase
LPRIVERRAKAKVNLALHVVGRRADSYHLLDSIAVFADCSDRIEIAPADRLKLTASGPFAAHAPADRSDLAWRAAEAFFAHTGLAPAACIRVEKAIPAGAGLGGGSADAAAALLGLNAFFQAGVEADALDAIGLRLGADVPMCLAGRALRARGVGEVIEAIEGWPPLPLVLAWPGRSVPTAAVFSGLSARENPPLPRLPTRSARATNVLQIAAWLSGCRNDLEAPALRLAPEIGAVLAALRSTEGCLLARMSGSGSACFGLYAKAAEAENAAARIGAARPDWWVRATTGQ